MTETSESYSRSRRRRRRRRQIFFRRLLTLCFAAVFVVGALQVLPAIRRALVPLHRTNTPAVQISSELRDTVEDFAGEHGLSLGDWPEKLLELAEKNPETQQFVLDYPLKKDLNPDIDLSEYRDASSVPLLLQWDERWGYSEYSDGLFGLTGCGPTCLSMVSLYLLNDPLYTPLYLAEFSKSHGYSVPGNGSAWTLISEGGPQLGLDVTEIPLDKNRVFRNLEAGNPIICVMGPGDFTTTGHFIVLTGCADGKLRVNDPNSRLRSEALWDYDQIQDQIRNLWVCRRL